MIALQQRGHALRWIHEPARLAPGDVCLLLSCGRLLSAEQLAMHRHNLVVHESDLPRGQGWVSLPRFQGQCLESCFYTDPMKTNDHNECPFYASPLQR